MSSGTEVLTDTTHNSQYILFTLSLSSQHSRTAYGTRYVRVYTLKNVCCDGFQGTPPNCYCQLKLPLLCVYSSHYLTTISRGLWEIVFPINP